ncbi:transcription factor TFIIH complex subunit Tfb5-domain-containing protein [Chiua virens]|nr:transcription factor TFIIH complex subunit Tfb5-domain-containing protein [Chiua virens]
MRAIKGARSSESLNLNRLLIGSKGILFTCDSAVKQILLSMNERAPFIIEDLDDYHLIIKADEEYRARKELDTELEKNTYSLEASQ